MKRSHFAPGLAPAAASTSLKRTPVQRTSSTDRPVTQWKSDTCSARGSAPDRATARAAFRPLPPCLEPVGDGVDPGDAVADRVDPPALVRSELRDEVGDEPRSDASENCPAPDQADRAGPEKAQKRGAPDQGVVHAYVVAQFVTPALRAAGAVPSSARHAVVSDPAREAAPGDPDELRALRARASSRPARWASGCRLCDLRVLDWPAPCCGPARPPSRSRAVGAEVAREPPRAGPHRPRSSAMRSRGSRAPSPRSGIGPTLEIAFALHRRRPRLSCRGPTRA